MKYFYLIFAVFIIFSCNPDYKQPENSDEWKKYSSYIPTSIEKITGTYERHDRFTGETLILHQDSTFKYAYYRDAVSEGNNKKSFSGHFEVFDDTLLFYFDRYEKYELFSRSIINYIPSYVNQQTKLLSLSAFYSPSYLKFIEGNLYIIPHPVYRGIIQEGIIDIKNKKIDTIRIIFRLLKKD